MTGYSSSNGFYIHAKTIIADYGTSDRQGVPRLGELLDNSLNDNRELGLIITDSGVMSGVESTFSADFTGSSASKVTVINPGARHRGRQRPSTSRSRRTTPRTGTLSYTATGLPPGLSISASTGVISGTASTAGTYNVTVTGNDSTAVRHRHLHLDRRLRAAA